jgi:hypothetical protein
VAPFIAFVRSRRCLRRSVSRLAARPPAPRRSSFGIGPSSFDHEVAPGNERHYLLAYKSGTLDIQIVDVSGPNA